MNAFHEKRASISLEELAHQLGVNYEGAADMPLSGLSALDLANETELSFLDNPKYAVMLPNTKAGAVILKPEMKEKAPEGVAVLLSDMPYATYAKALQIFYPTKQYAAGIHPKAHVESSAVVPASCHIGAGAYVGENVELGENVSILPNAYIAENVKIGNDTRIGANASIECSVIGNGCIIHAGACIGQDGFGFAYDGKVILKVPQVGMVKVGNFVEIGANTTVDRGSLSNTEIGDYSKLDNLVQIGHNVKLGRGCQLVSQCGIAGSTVLGDGCIVGGQAGSTGHIQIASGVTLAARSAATKNITEAGVYGGFPAQPMNEWKRQQVSIARLGKTRKKDKS